MLLALMTCRHSHTNFEYVFVYRWKGGTVYLIECTISRTNHQTLSLMLGPCVCYILLSTVSLLSRFSDAMIASPVPLSLSLVGTIIKECVVQAVNKGNGSATWTKLENGAKLKMNANTGKYHFICNNGGLSAQTLNSCDMLEPTFDPAVLANC